MKRWRWRPEPGVLLGGTILSSSVVHGCWCVLGGVLFFVALGWRLERD